VLEVWTDGAAADSAENLIHPTGMLTVRSNRKENIHVVAVGHVRIEMASARNYD
jgi:hypothetical protein